MLLAIVLISAFAIVKTPLGADHRFPKSFTVIERFDVEILNVDASDPNNTKVNCRVVPESVVLDSATFTAPGKTETKEHLSGHFAFSYDQSDLDWDRPENLSPETIRLVAAVGEESKAAECTVNRIRRATPQAREIVSAYFLAEGVGLRMYTHKLIEIYDEITYSVPCSGRTRWVGTSMAALFLDNDYENIGDLDWSESHRYTYTAGGTDTTGMVADPDGIGNPNTRYKKSTAAEFLPPNNLAGIATVTSLIYNYPGGVTPATPIVNSSIDRGIP